jgi:hypothetical protein
MAIVSIAAKNYSMFLNLLRQRVKGKLGGRLKAANMVPLKIAYAGVML